MAMLIGQITCFFRTECISREEKQKNMLQNGINTEGCKYNIKIQKIIFYFVVFFVSLEVDVHQT